MANERTRILIEIALTIALAAVLNYLKIWRMPQGGNVSLVLLPLIVLALRRGLAVGLVAGVLYGFMDLMIDAYIVHWAQIALDYPVAYGMVGLAGLMSGTWRRTVVRGKAAMGVWIAVLPATLFAAVGRYAAHVVSGVIFFGEYAPEGQPVLIYSALYNLYVPISAAAAFAAAAVILPVLENVVPVTARTSKV